MLNVRAFAGVLVALVLASTAVSAALPASAIARGDDRPLNGMLPRTQTITGRLVNMLPVQDPGTAGWQLQKPARLITLDVTNVSGRIARFQGQRVRLEGHYVFLGTGRTFVVTRIQRA